MPPGERPFPGLGWVSGKANVKKARLNQEYPDEVCLQETVCQESREKQRNHLLTCHAGAILVGFQEIKAERTLETLSALC